MEEVIHLFIPTKTSYPLIVVQAIRLAIHFSLVSEVASTSYFRRPEWKRTSSFPNYYELQKLQNTFILLHLMYTAWLNRERSFLPGSENGSFSWNPMSASLSMVAGMIGRKKYPNWITRIHRIHRI
jgi:hypothetical protein